MYGVKAWSHRNNVIISTTKQRLVKRKTVKQKNDNIILRILADEIIILVSYIKFTKHF